MIDFLVDEKRCVRCGLCVRDCPSGIIRQEGKAVPCINSAEDEEDCLECQHCLAVCPKGAISILGRKPEDSLALSPEALPRLEQMIRLVRGRRTVRHYRDENVDRALLDQILAALANAPTGVNRRGLTFHLVDDKDLMQRFRQQSMEKLAAADQAGRIPERYKFLEGTGPDYLQNGRDFVFRGAPHVLVVSAPPDVPCPAQDVHLTLAYFELLAQSAGLGTVWCGMLWLLLEALPELKSVIGLPANHVYYCMLFGCPAFRYARTVQRDDAAKVRRVTL